MVTGSCEKRFCQRRERRAAQSLVVFFGQFINYVFFQSSAFLGVLCASALTFILGVTIQYYTKMCGI